MENAINIIIAEDHEAYRTAIKEDLEEFNINTIAVAGNGKELLNLLKQGYKPDIILLDLNMPEMNGGETFTILMDKYPGAKVIVLSSYGESVLMEDFIERGAKTYVAKDHIRRDLDLLIDAIKKVHRGGIFPIQIDKTDNLKFTKKQKEMISYISEDKSKKEIAESLGVTPNAITKAEKRIMKRMNIKTREGLFSAIFNKGLNFFGKSNRKKKGD